MRTLPKDGLSSVISALRGRDLRAARNASRKAVTKDRAKATDSVWNKCWLPFLSDLGITDPFLTGVDDKIKLLRVFATQLQNGRSVVASRSNLSMFTMKSFTSQRLSPNWGPRTPISPNKESPILV
jgi:hypothetical protein